MNTSSGDSLGDRSPSPPPPPDTVVTLPSGGDFENLQDPQPQQPYDDDDYSGEIREYTGSFEGPEKTLEVMFRRINSSDDDNSSLCSDSSGEFNRVGLRTLARRDLDRICARARCTILSCVSSSCTPTWLS